MSEFEAEMQEFNEEWGEVQGDQFARLPDGTHQAIINVSRIDKAPWGDWQWSLQFAGQSTAGSVWKNHTLGAEEQQRNWAMQDARRLGFEGESWSEFAAWVADEELGPIDLLVTIKVDTKAGDTRDFTNVYLQRVHGKTTAPAAAGSRSVVTDDDIPF